MKITIEIKPKDPDDLAGPWLVSAPHPGRRDSDGFREEPDATYAVEVAEEAIDMALGHDYPDIAYR